MALRKKTAKNLASDSKLSGKSCGESASIPCAFSANLVDREPEGPPVTWPGGAARPRLPGYRRWMWDGPFCDSS